MQTKAKNKKYDIFLVDADDTLFDFFACSKNALKNAMKNCGIKYKSGDHGRYHAINDGLWKAIERKEIEHKDIFEVRFSCFLKEKGEDPSRWKELNDAYVAALSEECVPFVGAEEFLRRLKTFGRIFIVTNGTAVVQRRRFEKFGMSRFADGVFISEELGAYKPSAEFLDRAGKEIPEFDPSRAVIIGDSLTSDILLAKNCKIDSICYAPKWISAPADSEPTYVAGNYDEILKIIQSE